MRPLAGIRVVDLTTVAMGPLASQWLGDLGADVIKVETPGGDSTRHTGPAREPAMAAMFLGINRNKRSIVLDLKDRLSRESLLKLIDRADVFLHNVRPQKLARLGLDPQALRARNPRLIYAGLHGFGAAGPYGGRPAYDDTIQGLSGSADLMRLMSGQPGYFPSAVADKVTGVIAAMAIIAGLQGRSRTGVGTCIEIPMFESMVSFNLVEHFYGQHFDPPLSGAGYPRVLSPWRRPFQTQDGYICMMPYSDAHWLAFFEEAGEAATGLEPRFATISVRTRHIDELYSRAAALIRSKTTGQWLAICERRHIPAAPVLELDELGSDAHLVATGFFRSIDDAAMGTVRFPGVPVLFDGERPDIAFPPRLGAHTQEILREVGMTQAEIQTILQHSNRAGSHAAAT